MAQEKQLIEAMDPVVPSSMSAEPQADENSLTEERVRVAGLVNEARHAADGAGCQVSLSTGTNEADSDPITLASQLEAAAHALRHSAGLAERPRYSFDGFVRADPPSSGPDLGPWRFRHMFEDAEIFLFPTEAAEQFLDRCIDAAARCNAARLIAPDTPKDTPNSVFGVFSTSLDNYLVEASMGAAETLERPRGKADKKRTSRRGKRRRAVRGKGRMSSPDHRDGSADIDEDRAPASTPVQGALGDGGVAVIEEMPADQNAAAADRSQTSAEALGISLREFVSKRMAEGPALYWYFVRQHTPQGSSILFLGASGAVILEFKSVPPEADVPSPELSKSLKKREKERERRRRRAAEKKAEQSALKNTGKEQPAVQGAAENLGQPPAQGVIGRAKQSPTKALAADEPQPVPQDIMGNITQRPVRRVMDEDEQAPVQDIIDKSTQATAQKAADTQNKSLIQNVTGEVQQPPALDPMDDRDQPSARNVTDVDKEPPAHDTTHTDQKPSVHGDTDNGPPSSSQEAADTNQKPAARDNTDHNQLPPASDGGENQATGARKSRSASIKFISERTASRSSFSEQRRPLLPQTGVDLTLAESAITDEGAVPGTQSTAATPSIRSATPDTRGHVGPSTEVTPQTQGRFNTAMARDTEASEKNKAGAHNVASRDRLNPAASSFLPRTFPSPQLRMAEDMRASHQGSPVPIAQPMPVPVPLPGPGPGMSPGPPLILHPIPVLIPVIHQGPHPLMSSPGPGLAPVLIPALPLAVPPPPPAVELAAQGQPATITQILPAPGPAAHGESSTISQVLPAPEPGAVNIPPIAITEQAILQMISKDRVFQDWKERCKIPPADVVEGMQRAAALAARGTAEDSRNQVTSSESASSSTQHGRQRVSSVAPQPSNIDTVTSSDGAGNEASTKQQERADASEEHEVGPATPQAGTAMISRAERFDIRAGAAQLPARLPERPAGSRVETAESAQGRRIVMAYVLPEGSSVRSGSSNGQRPVTQQGPVEVPTETARIGGRSRDTARGRPKGQYNRGGKGKKTAKSAASSSTGGSKTGSSGGNTPHAARNASRAARPTATPTVSPIQANSPNEPTEAFPAADFGLGDAGSPGQTSPTPAFQVHGHPIYSFEDLRMTCLFCNRPAADTDPSTRICNGCGPFSRTRYCCDEHMASDLHTHEVFCGRQPLGILLDIDTLPERFALSYPAIWNIYGFRSRGYLRQRYWSTLRNHESDYAIFEDVQAYEHAGCYVFTQRPMVTVRVHDPKMRDLVNRLINLAFFNHRLLRPVTFLYRLLRSLLREADLWSETIQKELDRQFMEEFLVDVPRMVTELDPNLELEYFGRGGIERILDEQEKQYGILRLWRRQHPHRSIREDPWARYIGLNWRGAVEPDEYELGPGWNGLLRRNLPRT